jgi:Spy/CpxP family protein refolding chaperone
MPRLALIILLSIVSFSYAAPPATPASQPAATRPADGLMPAAMLDRARQLVTDLKLDDAQRAKVEKIFADAANELKQMRARLESMPVRERMAQVREFFDGVRADLAFVLTPEQRATVQREFEEVREAGPAMLPPLEETAAKIREAIPRLGLSVTQLQQVKDLFEDVRSRAQSLRQQIEAGDEDAKVKRRELQQETRDKLAEILSPEQLQKLREFVRQPASRPTETRERPRGRGKPGASAEKTGDTMMSAGAGGAGETMMEGASRERTPAKGDDSRTPASEKLPPGPAIGAAAPDFTLQKTDGGQVSLSSLKGRVIVLVFGSYSSPTFRNRAAALEKLRSEYGTRATFFVVYGREAHPLGEWEVSRNKEDGISVEQAKSIESRKAAATKVREKLKVTTPILLDSMGNDTAVSYGAGPNSAYVIGRDGAIAARQQWFEPLALRRVLDAATKVEGGGKPATKPSSD